MLPRGAGPVKVRAQVVMGGVCRIFRASVNSRSAMLYPNSGAIEEGIGGREESGLGGRCDK